MVLKDLRNGVRGLEKCCQYPVTVGGLLRNVPGQRLKKKIKNTFFKVQKMLPGQRLQ